MINGKYPSQFVQIEVMRTSHYRNLKNIVNKNVNHLSFPSPNFLQMSRRKKINHVHIFILVLAKLEKF